MPTQSTVLRIVILAVVVLFLAACGSRQTVSEPTETPVPSSEPEVEMDQTTIPAEAGEPTETPVTVNEPEVEVEKPSIPAESREPTEVHVTLSEFKIRMDKTSIPVGPVKFIIDNKGTLEHELVLEKAGYNDTPFKANGEKSEAEEIEPGESTTLEWTIDQAGEYQLGCHIEEDNVDHYTLGMVQTFTVTEK